MKKKLLIPIFAAFAAVTCVFGLSACDFLDPDSNTGGNNTEQGGNTGDGNNTNIGNTGGNDTEQENTPDAPDTPTHKHSYTESITAPTCTEQGYILYTCGCGESYQDNIPALNHNYKNGICENCGDVLYTEGLAYTLNDDGKSYRVSGIGSATATDIVIAPEYNGKPVTSIGKRAFYFCTSLTSVTLPDGIISIEASAFSGCSGLESITVASGNTVYHSSGNCLIKTASRMLVSGCKNSIIPTDGSVTIIGDSAFNGCSGLESISIPDSVTYIRSEAFSGCRNLTSVIIPDSVTYIGSEAFCRCKGLTSITIGSGVTTIDGYVFYECSNLTDVYYKGNEQGWAAIGIDGGNSSLKNATIHYN